MTNMPGWRRAAPDLKPLKDRIAVGLHLNLTVGVPLGQMPDTGCHRSVSRPADPAGEGAERQLRPPRIAAGDRTPARCLRGGFRRGTRLRRRSPACPCAAGRRQALDRGAGGEGLCRPTLAARPRRQAASVLRRPVGRGKALVVKALAKGFARQTHLAGFSTNNGLLGLRSARSLDPGREGVRGGVLATGAAPCRHVPPGLCGRRAAWHSIPSWTAGSKS